MNILYFILPISLLLSFGFVCAYLWAVKSGQFNDMETPSIRMLFEDEESASKTNKNQPGG